jgi:hypothetical protein
MSKLPLSAKAIADTKKLSVTCSLTNDTGKKIYLFTALWIVQEGKFVPAPYPAYASIDEKQKLHLGKVVHPLPKEKFVEMRYVPFARPVAANSKWEEKLDFDVPVQEFNPYYINTNESQWDEATITSLQVCVDWIAEVDGLKLHDSPLEGAYRLEHPEIMKRISRATSAPVPLKVAALRRADQFERFDCQP